MAKMNPKLNPKANYLNDKETLMAEYDLTVQRRLLDGHVRFGNQIMEGTPTEKDGNILKESSAHAVEKLVKQFSHASKALLAVYTQEVEKVCKDEPEEKIKPESGEKFSYKQPCCPGAEDLQTYVLTNFLNPHVAAISSCVQQPTTKPRSRSLHSLPSTTSGIPGTSAIDNTFMEQENNSANLKAKHLSSAELSDFRDLKLKSFHSVVFNSSKTSMWLCGQKKSKKLLKMGKYKPVFMCVELPGYKIIYKKTYSEQKIETPTIMLHIPDTLYFTGRNENTVYSLNTLSRKFKRKFSTDKLEIAAMCNNQHFLYNCNGNKPETISILDESFQPLGNIKTSLTFEKQCDFVDMCFLNHEDTHTVVISTSFPATVSAVSQSRGLVWQLDNRNFGNKFKPRSVTASSLGIVFTADCGTDKIHAVSTAGKDPKILLDKENGIQNPKMIRMDKEGKRLVIINRGGAEIRNYEIKLEGDSENQDNVSPSSTSGQTVVKSEPRAVSTGNEDAERRKMEKGLLELSKHIVQELDLVDIAIKGLEIPNNNVKTHLRNKSDSITMAAYSCFIEWQKQHDVTTARKIMNAALVNVGKAQLQHVFNGAWS